MNVISVKEVANSSKKIHYGSCENKKKKEVAFD